MSLAKAYKPAHGGYPGGEQKAGRLSVGQRVRIVAEKPVTGIEHFFAPGTEVILTAVPEANGRWYHAKGPSRTHGRLIGQALDRSDFETV